MIQRALSGDITQVGLFSQTTGASIEQVVQTNLIVPMLSCRTIMLLLPDADGWIMNIGSVFGAIGYPGQALYSASKFGLRGFTQALQRELGAQGVKIFYCAPQSNPELAGKAVRPNEWTTAAHGRQQYGKTSRSVERIISGVSTMKARNLVLSIALSLAAIGGTGWLSVR